MSSHVCSIIVASGDNGDGIDAGGRVFMVLKKYIQHQSKVV